MPTRPSFPDPPTKPGMLGLGLLIPLPQAATHLSLANEQPPLLPLHTHKKTPPIYPHRRRPEVLPRSLQPNLPSSPGSTPQSNYIKVLTETATTSCKVPLSPLPPPPATATASGKLPKPPLSGSRPKLKRSLALTSNPKRFPPHTTSLRELIPAIPLANTKPRRLSRSNTNKLFLSTSRTPRRYSRHILSTTSSRNNSSTHPSYPLSLSTSNSYTSQPRHTSSPIAALKLVRRPRVSPAASTRPTPASSVGAISVASWLELDDATSLPEDILCSSPEPLDPVFSAIAEEDWEDDVSQSSLPTDLTIHRNRPSGARKGLFRHDAIVRFTRTLKRARKAKASRKRRGSRTETVAEQDADSDPMRWSPQVSLFPHLAQILSTPRPPMVVTSKSKDATSPPGTQTDLLDPDVRNVLSSLWSTRPHDSPWLTTEASVGRRSPLSANPGKTTMVGHPREDKRLAQMATSDHGPTLEDEEDVLQMYQYMSTCPSDSRSSAFGSSAASSRSGSYSSSESVW